MSGMFDDTATRVAGAGVAHDHAWRLVQVDFDSGGGVSEYSCDVCAATWFA